jgi:hypothetical protein
MDGEMWSLFPGHNACFISNYGRIKSFVREKQRIIHQRVYRKGDIPILSFRVYVGCNGKEFTTAYAVYITFVGDLDFEKYKIVQKDGDGFNLHPSNLLAVKRRRYVMQEKKIEKQKEIALTATMYKYPYQNLSLVDMDGEIWEPFPDLPDYYAVSNKGRVKSLWRECRARDNSIRINAERIMKQRVQYAVNPHTKEKYCHLSVCTYAYEAKREFTVARLVYETFIGRIDVPALRVRYKDGNHFNNTPENLYLSSVSEIQNEMLQTGRRSRLSGCSNPEKWTQEEWTSFYDRTKKAVSQFDLDGNFVMTYESRNDAAKSVGIKEPASISAAITGRVHTIGGFQWRSGSDRSPMRPAKPIKPHLRKAFKPKRSAKYDLQGNLLKVYPSVCVAAKDNDMTNSYLYGLLQNPHRIPKGGKKFIWKYFSEEEEIPLKIEIE